MRPKSCKQGHKIYKQGYHRQALGGNHEPRSGGVASPPSSVLSTGEAVPLAIPESLDPRGLDPKDGRSWCEGVDRPRGARNGSSGLPQRDTVPLCPPLLHLLQDPHLPTASSISSSHPQQPYRYNHPVASAILDTLLAFTVLLLHTVVLALDVMALAST
ncbi:hypothetical protein DFH27DRAFT_570180, partial [Peziza echinospora]